jgi:hypothetical protein
MLMHDVKQAFLERTSGAHGVSLPRPTGEKE